MAKDMDKDELMENYEDDSLDFEGGGDLDFEDEEDGILIEDEDDVIPSVLLKGTPKPKTEDDWRARLLEASREGVPEYQMTDVYKEGDLIWHPVFGLGVVSHVITPKKMEVVYETSKKLMAMGMVPPSSQARET
ncbi:hypothetical protein [Desulfosoma caldarium]|uniref:Uncharacterized protein n=1 Tax=Desulfosoma caldarium TaxID=610254 RepID=A0A3N1URB3_9BACT|nr:hypothetical protein [Desulfosoma caldarium]ROQ91097.1 hypothetical protein EDC27_2374 [Desulfosoma caldarium]